MWWMLLLFIGLPMAELALLLKFGKIIGILETFAIIILTGALGATLARWQGLRVLSRIQQDVGQGKMPAPHLIDGVMILVASAVLLTPGFITDAIGFSLLIPPVRAGVRKILQQVLKQKLEKGIIDVQYTNNQGE